MHGYYKQQFEADINRAYVDPSGVWDNIRNHGSFFESLPLLPDALELWEGCKRLHPEPIILTGIPYSVPDAGEQKLRWVDKHIGPDARVICCASAEKREHGRPGDVLIDDWNYYQSLWEQMGGVWVLHISARESLAEAAKYFTSI